MRGERCKKFVQGATLYPAIIAAFYGLMVAKTLRQIAPAAAGTGHPEQRIHKAPIVATRPALTRTAAGNQVSQPIPLIVTQRVNIPYHQADPQKLDLNQNFGRAGIPADNNSSLRPRAFFI